MSNPSNPSKPSKHFCETGEIRYTGEYHPDIHNYEDTPYGRCSEYYDEYKAYHSWVAEIVFASSTYKLIKYYYSENEGAFEITHDGITNKNGSFKYEIVDTQSGGGISFKDGENTTSTYTKLFFVIYNGTAKFAANNMKVRECTSATNNGSYTYDGLNGNSLTSIKFTNMKADRSKLNAITSVVVPETKAPAAAAAQTTPAAPASVVVQTNQQAKATSQPVVAQKTSVEEIPNEVKTFKGVTLRNNKGTIQVYIPDGYSIAAYDIKFNKEIANAYYRVDNRGRKYDAIDISVGTSKKSDKLQNVYAAGEFVDSEPVKYEPSDRYQDMFKIFNESGLIISDAEITNAVITGSENYKIVK